MLKEIKVKLKGEDNSHSKKFLCYQENVTLSPDDPILKDYVEQTRQETKGQFDECVISIKVDWA